MAANEDPIVDKLREVAVMVKKLRQEREDAIAERIETEEQLHHMVADAEAVAAWVKRYDQLIERIRDHDRGIITWDELTEEIGART